MKIQYRFANGEVSEIEVDTELGALLLDLDRQEYNNDHKETRRHISLNLRADSSAMMKPPPWNR